MLTKGFCLEHGHEIQSVTQMLQSGRMGGFNIPYLGYIEAVVKTPQISQYCECFQILVLPTMPYSARVPVQIGTTVIDRAMHKITDDELVRPVIPGNTPT